MLLPFSPEELERYARHIVLPEIGGAGQQKLKRARVLVIGAGGLGAPVLQYLAAAGVGTLGIVDDDVVSLSNLQRQVIHDTTAIGACQARQCAKPPSRASIRMSASTCILSDSTRATRQSLLRATTSWPTARTISRRATQWPTPARAEHRPLVHAAVGRFDGSVTVLKPFETGADGRRNPSYRDLFPEPPPAGLVPSCAEAGILGALTGVIGTLQALEVIKLIAGIGEPLVGRLLLYDALAARFDTIFYKSA